MAAVIGALRADLSANTTQFEADMNRAAGAVDAFKNRLSDFGGMLQRTGAILSASLTAPLVLFGKASLDAFQESENAIASLSSALQSMGREDLPLAQLQAMAAELQSLTVFDDDEILSKVSSTLVTFGNVAEEEFGRAQAAVLDLSAKFGTDLQTAAIGLGKALNDPIQGLEGLRAGGIEFSDAQKDLIRSLTETGDIAGAQAVILEEVGRRAGGAAAAMAATTGGQMDQLRNSFGEFQEAVGGVIARFLQPLTEALKGVADWLAGLDDETVTWIATIGGIAAALGPVLAILGTLAIAIGALISPIGLVVVAVAGLIAAWVAFRDDITAIVEAVPQLITDTFEGIVAYLDAWVEGVVEFFTGMKDRVLAAVEQMVTGVIDWMTTKLSAAWAAGAQNREEMLAPFRWLADQVVGNSIIPDMVIAIGEWMRRLTGEMADPAWEAAGKTEGAFAGLADTIGTGLADAFQAATFKGEDLLDVLGNLLSKLADVVANQAFDLLGGVISSGINALFGGGGNGLPGGINDVIGAVLGRAGGGPVAAGMPYVVGERGPELFLPRVPGSIVPHDMLAGFAGAGDAGPATQNVFQVDMRGASVDAVQRLERLVAQVNGSIEGRSVNAVQRARSRNPGLFSER